MSVSPTVEEDLAPGELLVAVRFESDLSGDDVFEYEDTVWRRIEDDVNVSKHAGIWYMKCDNKFRDTFNQ